MNGNQQSEARQLPATERDVSLLKERQGDRVRVGNARPDRGRPVN